MKRNIFKYGLIALAAIILVVVGGYAYVVFVDPMSAFDKPDPTVAPTPSVTDDNQISPSSVPTVDPEEALRNEADQDFMKNRVNILLLGWDESPERNEEDSELYRDEGNNFRSDVIILLTVDFKEKTAKMISIPRDTMAPIYNTPGRWKINAAFAKGGAAKKNGFEYAMKTVSNLFGGVPIDYYAGVNMEGLKAVVDAMGGLDYDVDIRISINNRVLETGYQHLNGQQVLDYCRARKGISTDVGRTDRQQRILFAMFDQLKSKKQLANIVKIYRSVQGYVQTNLNTEQIAALGVFAMDLNRENLTRTTLEGKYISNTVYSNASFYVLYNDKLKKLVKETFGITIEPDPRYDVSYVEKQKKAKESLAYVDAANYIISMMPAEAFSGGSSDARTRYQSLLSARDQLLALCDFDDEAAPKMPDLQAILKAQQALSKQLVQQATWLGLTQQHFAALQNKSLLPRDVIAELPEEPTQATGGSTQNGENSGGFGAGIRSGIVDPEAVS